VLASFSVLLIYAARDTLLPSTAVRVATVVPSQGGSSSGSVSFQAAGWVEPDPYPIYVTTLTDGIVKEIPVLEGQKVKAGDVVVRLVDADAKLALARAEADLKQREAEIKSADAGLNAAQRDWDNPIERVRAVAIAESGLAASEAELHSNRAQVDLEQARADELEEQLKREKSAGEALPEFQRVQTELKLKTQMAALEVARKQQPLYNARVRQQHAEVDAAQQNLKLRITEARMLEEAKANVARAQAALLTAAVQRDEAKLRLERMTIKAPCDGSVYRRRVSPGSKMMLSMNEEDSGQAITLYDPKRLQVRVDVPLAEAASVSVGQSAQISVEVLRDMVFKGTVTRITNEADIQKNTLQMKVRIEDPAAELKPEMLARVQFLSAGSEQKATTTLRTFAPESALRKDGNGTAAWIVDKGRSVAIRRVLNVGSNKRDGWVEVTSGLQPGDSVIISDTTSLSDGERVRVMESKSNATQGGAEHGSH